MATAVRCRTRNGFLLLYVLRSLTHTQAASGPSCFLSVLFLPFLLLSSPLLSVSFSLPLSIPFCLVFFIYNILPYIILSFLSLFLLLHSNISSNHPLLFVPFFPFLRFRLSPLPLPLVYFSSFSNLFIVYTFHPFLIH